MFTQPVRTSSAKRRPLGEIAREDRREQAVRRRVGQLDRLVERVDRDDGRDRAEGLLLRDERVGRHAVEHRRLPVEVGREAGWRSPPEITVAPRRTASATCSSIFAATGSLFSGPIVVPSANGSPSTTRSVTSRASFATNSSRTSRCTSSRSPAVQLCPAQRKQAVTVASAASSRSASSSTTTGPFPPSSSTSRLARRGLGDLAAGLGRADEADAVRARVARDLVADHRAGPGDEVEDARRQVGLRRRTRRARPRRPPSTTRASRRRRCPRRARARSARPASCTASSTA